MMTLWPETYCDIMAYVNTFQIRLGISYLMRYDILIDSIGVCNIIKNGQWHFEK